MHIYLRLAHARELLKHFKTFLPWHDDILEAFCILSNTKLDLECNFAAIGTMTEDRGQR